MITDPIHTRSAAARGRARRSLAALAAAALLLVLAVVAAAWSALSGPHPAGTPNPGLPPAALPAEAGDWDLAAETALATRPMLALPEQAQAPQPLAAHPASAALRLPAASGEIAGIPAGFPNTPEGAVAALAALTTKGLAGADPQFYARTYQALATPGSPTPDLAWLTTRLRAIRSGAGMPPTGAVAGLTITWRPVQAQIKGVTDGGRYAVVCVLGQLSADYEGRMVAYGLGDCQAMRWVATEPASGATGQWLISPGAAAAPAPDAWPGSQDSVNAGYLELVR
jgi:hypothetical protein